MILLTMVTESTTITVTMIIAEMMRRKREYVGTISDYGGDRDEMIGVATAIRDDTRHHVEMTMK